MSIQFTLVWVDEVNSHVGLGQHAKLAGRTGAIDAVVAAMRVHVGNAGVSTEACLAVGKMC